MSDEIGVDVAFSPRAGVVDVLALRLPHGSRVVDALRASGIDTADAERPVGVWGKPCTLDQLLRDGDRVELYRALLIDPKDARRTRQRQQKLSGSRR